MFKIRSLLFFLLLSPLTIRANTRLSQSFSAVYSVEVRGTGLKNYLIIIGPLVSGGSSASLSVTENVELYKSCLLLALHAKESGSMFDIYVNRVEDVFEISSCMVH